MGIHLGGLFRPDPDCLVEARRHQSPIRELLHLADPAEMAGAASNLGEVVGTPTPDGPIIRGGENRPVSAQRQCTDPRCMGANPLKILSARGIDRAEPPVEVRNQKATIMKEEPVVNTSARAEVGAGGRVLSEPPDRRDAAVVNRAEQRAVAGDVPYGLLVMAKLLDRASGVVAQ